MEYQSCLANNSVDAVVFGGAVPSGGRLRLARRCKSETKNRPIRNSMAKATK